MGWMAWTLPTAIFFIVIGTMLAVMTVWEIISPTTARRGLLPLLTTRGDRLFIGLLASAFMTLGWIALTDINLWWSLAASTTLVVLIGCFG